LEGNVPPASHQDVEEGTTMGLVLDQDLENIPRVQKGLHATALRELTFGQHELRISHFHRMIDRYIANAKAPI
jgi:hypothetical protein